MSGLQQPATAALTRYSPLRLLQADRPVEEKQRRRSQQRVAAELAGGSSSGGTTSGTGSSFRGSDSGSAAAPAPPRSLQAFFEHCGVDFAARTISARARDGGLPPTAFLSADA